jgi:hypothetical protein
VKVGFWMDTAPGAAITALRMIGLAGKEERQKAVLSNFTVPVARMVMMEGLSHERARCLRPARRSGKSGK